MSAFLPLTKRFFAPDRQCYGEGGPLDVRAKELLGLVASRVLRGDDCVSCVGKPD